MQSQQNELDKSTMTTIVKKALHASADGIPLLPFALMALLSTVLMLAGQLQATGMPGSFALMWSIGFICFAVGERLPIWREYIGGGLIMAFLMSALLAHTEVIDASDAKFMAASVIDNRFMHFLLVTLVAANLLAVNRQALLKSLVGYVPIILAGVVGAMLLSVIVGVLVRIEPIRVITHYALPIMGGGNAAGAIPMAEVYADATGRDGAEYYGFAISVLTIANLIAVLAASILNQLGKKFPAITGNGQLMRKQLNPTPEAKPPMANEAANPDATDTRAAIFLVMVMLLTSFVLYALIPSVHLFAWAVLLTLLLNLFDLVPQELVKSLQTVSTWAMRMFLILVLVAVGLMTDLNELIQALTLTTVMIAGATVLGAIIGTALMGQLLGFYPLEAAITAGLCMANRGGSGDLEVLGAARRMELYPYSQLSSRIGGGMVLFIAGYLFSVLL
jgi:Na+/citrate or Na+/malate symporter